jgi:hypothetical protein
MAAAGLPWIGFSVAGCFCHDSPPLQPQPTPNPPRHPTHCRAPAGSPRLELDLTWQDKTPTRLPEAFWLRWAPAAAAVNASSWLLHKLGRPVSPLDVLRNGSHGLHAVGDEGVSVDSADGGRRLWIRWARLRISRVGLHGACLCSTGCRLVAFPNTMLSPRNGAAW